MQNEENNRFPVKINVKKIKFHIPKGYKLNFSDKDEVSYSEVYTKEESEIIISVSTEAIDLRYWRLFNNDIGYPTVDMMIANQFGFERIDDDSNFREFFFIKEGTLVGITLSPDFDFQRDLEKIIG
jgi:hypothetical protein